VFSDYSDDSTELIIGILRKIYKISRLSMTKCRFFPRKIGSGNERGKVVLASCFTGDPPYAPI